VTTTTTAATTVHYFIRPVGRSRIMVQPGTGKIKKGRKSWQEIGKEELWV
jgi:hypothetical protein